MVLAHLRARVPELVNIIELMLTIERNKGKLEQLEICINKLRETRTKVQEYYN